MKTYTLEELKLAQAKKCRVEYASHDWFEIESSRLEAFYLADPTRPFRIHPADEWKARLPRLREGAEWAFDGCHFQDARPYVIGERYHGRLVAKKGFAGFTTIPVPPEFLHESELAKQPEAAQAPDFGEPWTVDYSKGAKGKNNVWVCEAGTGAIRDRIIACVNALSGVPDPAKFVRRALAAEARVKELETDLNEAIEGRKYNSDCINRRAIERDEARADLHKARAALRLRPIAEAGPVPEGMIRLYAHRISLGPPGTEFWSAFSETDEEDTHCVDVWPPSQAQEGGQA